MNLTDLLLAQLLDPFRVGLLVALLLTSMRTAREVGTLVPLALGVVFVAVIIPMTTGSGQDRFAAIAVGLVANAVIMAVLLAAAYAWRRMQT